MSVSQNLIINFNAKTMKTFNKTLIGLICLTAFSLHSFAQTSSTPPKKKEPVPQVKSPEDLKKRTPEQVKALQGQYEKLSPEEKKKKLEKEQLERNVDASINILKQKVLKKNNDELYGTEIKIYAMHFMEYSKSPYIEEVTHIYREWYKKISECLDIMSEAKSKLSLAQLDKNEERIKSYGKAYEDLQDKLEKILKNPPRITKKKK